MTLKRQLVRNRLCDPLCSTKNCIICPNGKDGGWMSSGGITSAPGRDDALTTSPRVNSRTKRRVGVSWNSLLVAPLSAPEKDDAPATSPHDKSRIKRHVGDSTSIRTAIIRVDCPQQLS
ncbi:hypothetical protein KIN20_000084 [Parelaphostrongylus tenuis]|uniref:Uncharacterized protein n=1 Tax=Parelaphostrongylus tenuis TaxID=148309 RepID=A0AAD5LVL3_PARTN|nr:hypothetical protein KIN20_000084 [Parelaphostrongylus tenuis]